MRRIHWTLLYLQMIRALFLSHQHFNTIYKKLNEELAELKRIGDWLKANKLYLNNNKTKYILFHKKQQIYKVSSFKNSR